MRRVMIGLGIAAATLLAGCNNFRLKPPDGFAEVDKDDYGSRMKAGDDVGLSVKVFENVRGGDLQFWSADLVKKLGKRGYALIGQSEARSKNGVSGTRFDFTYTIPGSDEKKFYTVVLFASDANVVAVQLAGDDAKRGTYAPRVDAIASSTVVRGCKAWTRMCKSAQPGKLTAPPPDPVPMMETEIASGETGGSS